MTVQEALNIALSAKLQSDSERTRQTFSQAAKMFTFFIVTEKIDTLPIQDFTKLHVVAYLDHLSQSRSLSNISYHNYNDFEILPRERSEQKHFEHETMKSLFLVRGIEKQEKSFTVLRLQYVLY